MDWPPTGVVVLRNGVMLGGGPYSYYTGSFSSKDGIFKGELVLDLHTPPPSGHLFSGAENVGMGISGTYAGDQAELTGTVLDEAGTLGALRRYRSAIAGLVERHDGRIVNRRVRQRCRGRAVCGRDSARNF